MISRYTRPEMAKVWTEDNKYQAWLEVEILASVAWAELAIILKDEVKNIQPNDRVDAKRIQEIEQDPQHDVVAITRQLSETLGEEKKWVHYGVTSKDVVDTAQSFVLKQANELIQKDL